MSTATSGNEPRCIFCGCNKNLTDEHVFPAFMGGKVFVKDGSCERCNGDFSRDEAAFKNAVAPLIHLLGIKNRYGIVRNADVDAQVKGLDMNGLKGFIDGKGDVTLFDKVEEGVAGDGRRMKRGFFWNTKSAEKFAERGKAKGEVIEREVPKEIVIEANYSISLEFVFSLAARRVAAKIALAALAYLYGIDYALSAQFDEIRKARTATGQKDLRVWVLANKGLMSAYIHTAQEHSVFGYLSPGWKRGWAVVTLFGGIMYRVDLSIGLLDQESHQFSIFYDAEKQQKTQRILLANEMTLIGHMLSEASKFEDQKAVADQFYPILSAACEQKGLVAEEFVKQIE